MLDSTLQKLEEWIACMNKENNINHGVNKRKAIIDPNNDSIATV